MNYCTSCGSPIPDGQGNSCSMCYGDIDHGADGYYTKWLEKEYEREQQERDEEAPMPNSQEGGDDENHTN